MTAIRYNLSEYNWELFYKELQEETPRAAVTISGAFLDALLKDLLASFMIEDDKAVSELLGTEGDSAPLSDFGARINAAFCLGLITRVEYNDLKYIKKIRNRFAHEMHGYSFDKQQIVDWCNNLQTPIIFKDVIPVITGSHYDKYVFTVAVLSNQLGIKILDGQKERRIIRDNVELGQVERVEE
jgi:DNA-binding MltR family transcriptional regulator